MSKGFTSNNFYGITDASPIDIETIIKTVNGMSGMIKNIGMTHKEILEKAIQKAIDNGYKLTNFAWIPEDKRALLDYWFTADNYKAVIFNHKFAKALWGETDILQDCVYCKTPMGFQHPNPCPYAPLTQVKPLLAAWRYHLQQMVISDDPIVYLGEHI